MNLLLEAALELASLGCHVIPVAPRGKKPLVEWKEYQQRKPTDLDIRVWWERDPDANIGVVFGRGTLAVDCDAGGRESLDAAGIQIPDSAPLVRTPSGGFHAYFRGSVPDKVRVLPGVDVRGVGFVVAPPSIGANGVPYVWERRLQSLDELPECPPALLALLNKDTSKDGLYAPEAPDWVTRLIETGSGQGTRNADGTRLAGYLYRALPSDIAKALLHLWNTRNTPPLSVREVETIAASISRRAIGEQAISLVSPDELRQETLKKSDSRTVGSLLEDLSRGIHVPTRFIETPFPTLNKYLFGGVTRQEYVILGGRPSVGKTAIANQCALYAAEQGHRVLFVTLEMSASQLAARLAVLRSGIPAGQVRRGGLSGPELERFNQAAREMRDLPISIEAGLNSAEEIFSLVEAGDDGETYDLLIVDYLQCLRPLIPNRASDRRLEIDSASAWLKKVPRQLSVPMLAISSLARKDGEPTMHELKESGSLEYDADIILLLHREKFDRRIKATLAKARNAQVGPFDLYYDGSRFSFSESDDVQIIQTVHVPRTETEYEQPF